MPLIKSKSPAAFKTNVRTLMGEVGKSPHVQSRKQALAIAYATQRRGAKRGGRILHHLLHRAKGGAFDPSERPGRPRFTEGGGGRSSQSSGWSPWDPVEPVAEPMPRSNWEGLFPKGPRVEPGARPPPPEPPPFRQEYAEPPPPPRGARATPEPALDLVRMPDGSYSYVPRARATPRPRTIVLPGQFPGALKFPYGGTVDPEAGEPQPQFSAEQLARAAASTPEGQLIAGMAARAQQSRQSSLADALTSSRLLRDRMRIREGMHPGWPYIPHRQAGGRFDLSTPDPGRAMPQEAFSREGPLPSMPPVRVIPNDQVLGGRAAMDWGPVTLEGGADRYGNWGGRGTYTHRFAFGGALPFYARQGMYSLAKQGMLASATPGRADKIATNVASGSHIIPADVVSGKGQGNSLAGAASMDKMFKQGPMSSGGAGSRLSQGPFGKSSGIVRKFAKPSFGGARLSKIDVRAKGGTVGKPTAVALSGGEYIVEPDAVARKGRGNMKRGHDIIDGIIHRIRKQTIRQMRRLPGPKK